MRARATLLAGLVAWAAGMWWAAAANASASAPRASLVGSPNVFAGTTVGIKGTGWGSRATVTITLGTDKLGTRIASATGSFDAKVFLPSETSGGTHDIVVAGTAGSARVAIDVVGGIGGAGGAGGVSRVAVTGAHTGRLSLIATGLILSGTAFLIAGRRRRPQARAA